MREQSRSRPNAAPSPSVAFQGELGSNSHMASLDILSVRSGRDVFLAPCATSQQVFDGLEAGEVELGVLPIENSLHGTVAEHLDLLLERDVFVVGESMLRIRHNVIAAPGVGLAEVRKVMSHPVALSQCRRWLRAHPQIEVVACYDTAGSVKQVMDAGWTDVAGIAPELAAGVYGAEILVRGIEDHPENYTRFFVLAKTPGAAGEGALAANKMSVAFSLEHRPGSLMEALDAFRRAELNLTKIESRPVHGSPWEYVFFADVRFETAAQLECALKDLRLHCKMVKELGRYRAA